MLRRSLAELMPVYSKKPSKVSRCDLFMLLWHTLFMQLVLLLFVEALWHLLFHDSILTSFEVFGYSLWDVLFVVVASEIVLRNCFTLAARRRIPFVMPLEFIFIGGLFFFCFFMDNNKMYRTGIILNAPISVYLMMRSVKKKKLPEHPDSSNKKRLRHSGFDLDLAYITSSVIAMSDPSDSDGANRLSSIVNWLDLKHRNHFLIFNLSSGSSAYDPNVFNNRTEFFPIVEKGVPHLHDMLRFCERVHGFLADHRENVIVVHSKEGYNRTGLMICAWLLYTRVCSRVSDAVMTFAQRRLESDTSGRYRTIDFPSQLRYLDYFYRLTRGSYVNMTKALHLAPTVTLTSIVVDKPMLSFSKRRGDVRGIWITITESSTNSSPGSNQFCEMIEPSQGMEPLLFNCCGLQLRGDLCFKFFIHPDRSQLLCSFWLHSLFLDRKGSVSLTPETMDIGMLDVSEKSNGFRVSVNYQFLDSGIADTDCASVSGFTPGQNDNDIDIEAQMIETS